MPPLAYLRRIVPLNAWFGLLKDQLKGHVNEADFL
jgi:hypothetical protein